jgi:hypothetical protein
MVKSYNCHNLMNSFDFLPLSLQCIIGGFAIFLCVLFLSQRKNSTYPGPPGWPLIGNLLDIRSTQPVLKHPGKTFFQWSKQYSESDTIKNGFPFT